MSETNPIIPHHQPALHPNLQALEHFLMHDQNDSSPLDNIPLLQSPVADAEITHRDDQIINEETCTEQVHDETKSPFNEFGNPIVRLPSWPLEVPPYTCSCCQILREITHTNGFDITKLEIHGRLGSISHGVLEKYSIDLTTNRSHKYKMFDFCKESLIRVKQFLVEYCNERKVNAFVMLQDPLSSFYEAVCVGLDWEDKWVVDDLIPQDSGDRHMVVPCVESTTAPVISVNKTTYSIQREQRERTRKLTIRDLVGYFRFPIEIAAKEIRVCPTVIKRICRTNGLSRWPYRKIKSIEKKISKKSRHLTSMVVEERSRAQAEIDKLQQEISDIIHGSMFS